MRQNILISVIISGLLALIVILMSCGDVDLTVPPIFSYNNEIDATHGSAYTSYKPAWVKKPDGITYSLEAPATTQLSGISIDDVTGVISIPKNVSAATETWTVKASANGAVYSASVEIKVQPKYVSIESLSYSSTYIHFETDTAKTVDAPNVRPELEDDVTRQYSIKPNLPNGLEIDSSTGMISGRPTTAADAKDYTVTLSLSGNFKGTKRVKLIISVGNTAEASFSYSSGIHYLR